MKLRESVIDKSIVQNFLVDAVRKFSPYCPGDLSMATPLIRTGIVDSLTIMEVTKYIESCINTSLPVAKINRESFRTLEALSDMLFDFIKEHNLDLDIDGLKGMG
ncbi:MAG: hypothetical protein CL521_03470 [Actinobacteria bacterium]|nr:hypothetical protein [Actinomycetota bacterium]